MDNREIKWKELKRLFQEGKIQVPPSTVGRYLYGWKSSNGQVIGPGAWRDLERSKSLKRLGASNQLLTSEQEEFLTALVVNAAKLRRPIFEDEVHKWAATTAFQNSTSDDPDADVRKWGKLWKERVRKRYGFNIESLPTQQLSQARSAVAMSDMRVFQDAIGGLLLSKPDLAVQGLKVVGDYDEWKVDINKIQQGKAMVPEGVDPYWEVEAERCAQITVLSGFVGSRYTRKSMQQPGVPPAGLSRRRAF